MSLSYSDYTFDALRNIISEWNWDEVKYGYDKGMINSKDVIEYAKTVLSADISDFDLILKLSWDSLTEEEISSLLSQISSPISLEEIEQIKEKWQFTILQFLYDNRKNYSCVNKILDMLYADFEYPNNMSNLVSYMPYSGDPDSSIEKRWASYLQSELQTHPQWQRHMENKKVFQNMQTDIGDGSMCR